MQMQDIVRRVRDLAGDSGALQFTNATLTDWVNDAVLECAEENSLLQKTAATSTVAGQHQYDLPADIYKIYSINVDNQSIRLMTLQEFKALNSTSTVDQGTPNQAYIWSGKLFLSPTPNQVLPLRIDYIYNPVLAVYTNDLDVAWKEWVPAIPSSYHRRLVSYCLAMVAYQDDNQERGDLLMSQFKTGVIDQKNLGTTEDDLYSFISVSPRDMGEAGVSEW